jgi:hypothetical protein
MRRPFVSSNLTVLLRMDGSGHSVRMPTFVPRGIFAFARHGLPGFRVCIGVEIDKRNIQ